MTTTRSFSILCMLFAACSGNVPSSDEVTATPLSAPTVITDATGLCVDVRGGDTTSGTPIQLWTCNGNPWQKWTYQDEKLIGAGGKCLDVQWADPANGTPIQLWDCNGTAAQQWKYDNGQLIGLGGKCLDVDASHVVSGQPLQIWDCNGGKNQQFQFGEAPTPPSPMPPSMPPTGDLAAAKAFLAPLRIGFNVERGWAWSVPGGPRATAQYLASLGVTHVRLFFPWSPTTNYGGLGFGVPSQDQMRSFWDGVGEWIAGGMVVFVDQADLLGTDDFDNHRDTIYAEEKAMAELAATYNFPKDKLAIGPVNEWIGDDGNGGDPYGTPRTELHAILRQALPGYVLTVSSEYWDYWRNLLHLQPVADQRVIYAFHAYEQHSPDDWTNNVVAPITDWSRQHGGVPIFMGEAGPYGQEDWAAYLDDLSAGMSVFRPALWAITYGSVLRWNNSADDATLPNALRDAVIRARKTADARLAGNDGAP